MPPVQCEVIKVIAGGRKMWVHEEDARNFQRRWKAELDAALGQAELLAWPTMASFSPTLDEPDQIYKISLTGEVNVAGLPALAQPVATPGPLPASLQLVGPMGGEERLVATGAVVEGVPGGG